ncbi:ADP-ribosylglycohydrolase family protein [Terrimonas sp. NA20]|uniref:ADP-ribosylglycohydrolase family protein n=1 Tax=Terrimonas ginsenosidimutans TaxID=2908004 RepID=A0ABS9KWB0_9BACT|nr:ADP-ribosylglycohydrolase family protein [Terrimonas ginsenosidimutans]MCG2616547.1 ADP-ribosylglycohydrolase family protein [Terrimonas ginsenosidimutans]
MIKHILSAACISLVISACAQKSGSNSGSGNLRLSKDALQDKIRGGWAGQTIGVTFGGPYEFRYNGTFIQENQPLVWYDGYLKKTMTDIPGLYDDIYMDLTFVDILERVGFDAPIDSFANSFARAGYDLWFANQAARYNILQGIKAPASGEPKHNLQADAIDYQIEADYSGLMNPGMPNSASTINDKIGHIMNYGDGWYGGVYVGAMYSIAFTSNDVAFVVKEALKTIPAQSEFHQCISDVIKWHKQYPDWHSTWFELQKKWANDMITPQGVFVPFNIDAKINAAYVVMGLLYGNGDFSKTLDISTRAGQDADCNPSTAGGVLGTILGYNKIPAYWKQGLKEIEDINFSYTTISLNKVYELSFKHALEMIKRNGGTVEENSVVIKTQAPAAVRYEKSFPEVYPQSKVSVRNTELNGFSFEFEGTGFALLGRVSKKQKDGKDTEFTGELYIDGQKVETAQLPTAFHSRRHELFWNLGLSSGKHTVKVVITNPDAAYDLKADEYVIYGNKPAVVKLP